jgi:isopropylmalate/homocitrate/citramalate synthase
LNKVNINKIENFFKIGRKKGITLAFLTQRYYDTSKFVRAQVSYVLLGSIGNKDVKAIIKDSGSDLNNEQMMKIFKAATKKQSDDDLPFLKVTMIECPVNQKYSRNFTDFFQIE